MKTLFLIFALLSAQQIFALDSTPNPSYGVEIRQYPLGTIPSLQSRIRVGDSLEGLFNLGANIAYHGDQGVQDHEHGIGFGGGFGLRKPVNDLFFIGTRMDLWRMSIEWTNSSRLNQAGSGTSHFLVIQPTVEIGSNFFPADKSWVITPTLSFGGEINTFDNDEPTGQGFIVLLGISIGI